MKYTLLLVFFFSSAVSISQELCSPSSLPFQSGESLTYVINYNHKDLWIPSGEVTFKISDTVIKNKSYIKFFSEGHTLKKFDLFFKVRDQYLSIVSPTTLSPIRFKRIVNEGSFKLTRDYIFDTENNHAISFSKENNKPLQIDTINVPTCSWDVITAIYRCRSIDFTSYKINDTIPISLLLDNQIYSTKLTYLGKATHSTLTGKEYSCIKFSIKLIQGTIFKENAEMIIYVTDDKNHIPLYIESEILVGTIKAYLIKGFGYKYATESLLKN